MSGFTIKQLFRSLLLFLIGSLAFIFVFVVYTFVLSRVAVYLMDRFKELIQAELILFGIMWILITLPLFNIYEKFTKQIF